MTVEEFHMLCKTTETGTILNFKYQDTEIKGHFIGCGEDEVVIEANGRQYIWPRELCRFRKSDYPIPSYS